VIKSASTFNASVKITSNSNVNISPDEIHNLRNASVSYRDMIVHYNHNKPVSVYVVNSRLPVYKTFYGDGFGNLIEGLFTRAAPKIMPLAKQMSMRAIDVIRDKGISAIGNLAGKTFSTVKDKIISLAKSSRFGSRRPPQKQASLPSTTVMPANVSKMINNVVQQKLSSIANSNQNEISNLISGSGLKYFPKKSSRKRK